MMPATTGSTLCEEFKFLIDNDAPITSKNGSRLFKGCGGLALAINPQSGYKLSTLVINIKFDNKFIYHVSDKSFNGS